MSAYIEVTGAADAEEQLVEQRIAIDLSVRPKYGVKKETARESKELHTECTRKLLEAGVQREELMEGGGGFGLEYWWNSRTPNRESHRRILVSCTDQERIQRAMVALEPIFTDPRDTISIRTIDMRFDCSQEAKSRAMEEAVANARAKAATLAEASGVELGKAQRVEELSGGGTRSGARGDDAWMGPIDLSADLEGESEFGDHAVNVEPVRRVRKFRVRVRFSIR